MSPEERVKAIGEWIKGDPLHRIQAEVLWPAVASAIREAEDEALERAAKAVADRAINAQERAVFALLVTAIRSLKSSKGERT